MMTRQIDTVTGNAANTYLAHEHAACAVMSRKDTSRSDITMYADEANSDTTERTSWRRRPYCHP
jgi:hypothetical protein